MSRRNFLLVSRNYNLVFVKLRSNKYLVIVRLTQFHKSIKLIQATLVILVLKNYAMVKSPIDSLRVKFSFT